MPKAASPLKPDEPEAYFNLGAALANSGHYVEAAQRLLEAKERHRVGSEGWAQATAVAFLTLTKEACAVVAKPEWWSYEGLKALSMRVVRAAPDDVVAAEMRAVVLSGQSCGWEAFGPRSAAELREAATHWERAAALCPAPALKANHAAAAAWCRLQGGARSAAELREAATHFDRAAALCLAPAMKAALAERATWCRAQAEAM